MTNPNFRASAVAAAALFFTMAAANQGDAAGETIGYSSPFLFSQFQVILQDQAGKEAEAAGLNMLAPTNADGDSGKQITDVRSLIGAGATGLIVVANDSKAIIPALEFAAEQKVPVVSIDIGPDGGTLYAIVRADNIGMGWIACEAMAQAIGDSGKVLSLQGAQTSINGRERTQGFHDCITEKHPNIELIERPTDWDAQKQAAALQTVLAANPDLKGVFQQSDYALSPTLNVLKQAGRAA
jgi:ribose transport system substrate-binding protein